MKNKEKPPIPEELEAVPPQKQAEEINKNLEEFAMQRKEDKLMQQIQDRERIIAELTERIEKLAHDPVTGLKTSHTLAEKEKERRESGKPWSVLLLDIDGFKKINDTWGHDAGDAALKQVAEYLQKNPEKKFRETDEVVRLHGDEIAVIVKNATPEDILRKLFDEKDKRAEISLEVNFEGRAIPITLSGGITSFGREEEIKEAMRRADEALYFSKNQGRNRISTSNDVERAER